MADEFHAGQRVSWNSAGGTSHGKILRKLTSRMKIKDHEVAASENAPQYLVETDEGAQAAHKPEALTPL